MQTLVSLSGRAITVYLFIFTDRVADQGHTHLGGP